MQWNKNYYNFVNVQINNSQIVILKINYKCNNLNEKQAKEDAKQKLNAAATAASGLKRNSNFNFYPTTIKEAVEIVASSPTSSSTEANNVENTNNIKFIQQQLQQQQQNGFQLPNQQLQQQNPSFQSNKFNTPLKLYQSNDYLLIIYYYLCFYNYLHFHQKI